MKRCRISLLFFLFIFSLSALSSCGGGGGSSGGSSEPDFASITVEGGEAVLYTEAADSNATAGCSPYLTSYSTGTATGTYLYSMDWNGSDYDTRFELHTWGTGAGTFSINGDYAMVIFMPAGGPTYSCVPGAQGVSGTINITEFGPVGGKVKGTFDVVSLMIVNSSITGTARLTGSFSVTRE